MSPGPLLRRRWTSVLIATAALATVATAVFVARRHAGRTDPAGLDGLRTREGAAVPGTETATPRDPADKDGWSSEVFSDVAGARLKKLGKLLRGEVLEQIRH